MHAVFRRYSSSQIHVRLAGNHVGCYDAVGVCTHGFSVTSDKMGEPPGNSWSIHLYPSGTGALSGCHHDGDHKPFFNQFVAGGIITLRVSQRRGQMEVLWNGESQGVAFSNLPLSEPLFFVARVCGHDKQVKLKILDEVTDFSPSREEGGDDYDGSSAYEEEEE